MPLASFDSDFKPQVSPGKFPKLKLKHEEKARIYCFEPPVYEWTHVLEAPVHIDGEPVMEAKTKANGDTYEVHARNFLANPLCLGDIKVLEGTEDSPGKGVDPENCPACAKAASASWFKPPTRRYAMNVLKYKTKPGSDQVQKPLSLEVLLWTFSEKVYARLHEMANSEEDGPINQYDLRLTCLSGQWQQYQIEGSRNIVWKANEDTVELANETYNGNKEENLSWHCGRKLDRGTIEAHIRTIEEQWDIINKTQANTKPLAEAEIESLGDGLTELRNNKSSVVENDDVFSDDFVKVETTAKTDEDAEDFDTLTEGLGI